MDRNDTVAIKKWVIASTEKIKDEKIKDEMRRMGLKAAEDGDWGGTITDKLGMHFNTYDLVFTGQLTDLY